MQLGGKSTPNQHGPAAFRWSQEFAKMDDPSGRAVKGVHLDAISTV